MEKELVDWKENSGSNKRFNGILMRFLSTLPQEDKKEWIRCEKCGEHINFKITPTPSPLDSTEEVEEINMATYQGKRDTAIEIMVENKLNELIRNQTKIINYLKGKK